MQAQGTAPTNAAFFTALTEQINAIDTCAELQTVVNGAMASLQAEKTAIEAQLSALEPVLALLELPTDLGSVISWIGNLANHLIGPIVIPYTTYATQLTQMAEQIAGLVTAIENAAARIESCTITVPPIT